MPNRVDNQNRISASTPAEVEAGAPAPDAPQRATQERAQHGAEFATHGDAERIEDAIRSLYKAGEIGKAEQWAADRWLRTFQMGLVGVRRPDASGIRGGRSTDGYAASRLDAITSHRAAERAIGPMGVAVLYASQVDGVSLQGLARQFGKNAHFWSGALAMVLAQLANHYSQMDGCLVAEARA